uniref:Uncharacterized protein n=1 Tax=Strigamia maritima TaxID=126957 RepID=T1IXQ0_STRMM
MCVHRLVNSKDETGFHSGSQNKIRANEMRIAELRSDINNTKRSLSKMIPEDERLLRSVFIRHPNEFRVIRDKSCAEAREFIDDKVLQLHRELECLRIHRQEQEERLMELSNRLSSMRTATVNGPDSPGLKIFQSLDNNLSKTRIRSDTARVIRDRYAVIFYNLQQDERSYPELISKLDKAAHEQGRELQDVKVLCLQAQEVRDNLRETLNAMEFEIFQVKQEREGFINFLRKEVEKRNEQPEAKKSKVQEDTSKDNTGKAAAAAAAEAVLLQNFKHAHEKLLSAANVADLKHFWTSWKRLSKASRHLREQLIKSAERTMRLSEEKAKLTEVVQEMRFTGGVHQGHELLRTQLEDTLKTQQIQHAKTTRNMHDTGALLQDIRLGLESLVTRLGDVELQPTYGYARTGDEIVDNLLRCDAVLRQIMKEVDRESGGDIGMLLQRVNEDKTIKPEDLFAAITKIKIRIEFIDQNAKAVVPGYMRDDEDQSYGLTRHQIKAISDSFFDNGPKRRRRKRKK